MQSFAKLKVVLTTLVLVATSSMALAEASRPTRFWNLTRHTISELALAPAGTNNFGPNQCKNDRDGTVDPDDMETGTQQAPSQAPGSRSSALPCNEGY